MRTQSDSTSSSSSSCLVVLLAAGAAVTSSVAAGASNVFDVTAYGAVGDGKTYDTAAIRKAAASLLARGSGGTLLFPAGKTYLTGSFNLSSNTHVEIQKGATVLGSTRGEDWPLVVARTVWPQVRLSAWAVRASALSAQPVCPSHAQCVPYHRWATGLTAHRAVSRAG